MKLPACYLFIALLAGPALLSGSTWYVRSDGGDRSQCTGTKDAPYSTKTSGKQDCGLKHPFYLFTTDPPTSRAAEAPQWIVQGGDTIVLKNGEYRIGYKSNELTGYWNVTTCRGNPANCS